MVGLVHPRGKLRWNKPEFRPLLWDILGPAERLRRMSVRKESGESISQDDVRAEIKKLIRATAWARRDQCVAKLLDDAAMEG